MTKLAAHHGALSWQAAKRCVAVTSAACCPASSVRRVRQSNRLADAAMLTA